jgi:hypothetical protein
VGERGVQIEGRSAHARVRALLNRGGRIGQRRHGARPAPMPAWMAERGEIGRCARELHVEDDDFAQAGTLVRDALDDAERDGIVSNIVVTSLTT